MSSTVPSSPTKRGNTLPPGATKKIIKFVEGLKHTEKEFQIFKDKLQERFKNTKNPRNKLPALTISFDES